MEHLDEWDPRKEEFNDSGLSSFTKGPAKHYSRSIRVPNDVTSETSIGLYLKNVPLNISSEVLKSLLSRYANVLSIFVGKPNEKCRSSNITYAIAKVETMRDALTVIEKVSKKPPLYLNIELAQTPDERAKKKNNSHTAMNENAGFEREKDSVDCGSVFKPSLVTNGVGRGKLKFLSNSITKMNETADIQNLGATNCGPRLSPTLFQGVEANAAGRALGETPISSKIIGSGRVQELLPRCVRCNFTGSKRCSICKAWYCSKECQYDDWYYHKEKCVAPPPLEDGNLESTAMDVEAPSHPTITTSETNGRQTLEMIDSYKKLSTPNKNFLTTNQGIVDQSPLSPLKPLHALTKQAGTAEIVKQKVRFEPETEVNKSFFNVTSNLKLNMVYEGVITTRESVERFTLMMLNEFTGKVITSSPGEFVDGESLLPQEVKMNEVVMAQSPSDEGWYRALVYEDPDRKDNTVKVSYIDYGNQENVSSLRKVPPALDTSLVPGLALSAALHKQIQPEELPIVEELIQCDGKIKFKVTSKKTKSILTRLQDNDGKDVATYVMRTISCSNPAVPPLPGNSSDSKNHEPIPSSVNNSTPSSTVPVTVETIVIPPMKSAEQVRLMRKDLNSQTLNAGEQYLVALTWITDEALILQLFSEQEKDLMISLHERVAEYCRKACAPKSLVKGELVCALSGEDETWYRAEVTEEVPVEAKDVPVSVYYFDFGNSEHVPLQNVRPFDPSLMEVPVKSFAVQPIGRDDPETRTEWEKTVSKILENGEVLLMKVVSTNPLKVQLMDANTKKPLVTLPNKAPVKTQDQASPVPVEASGTIPKQQNARALMESGSVKPSIHLYDECKTVSLPIAKGVEVVVMQVANPLNLFFTINDVSLVTKLEQLSDEMNTFCNSLQKTYYVPKEGEICLAKYSADGLWYRAACISLEKDAATVFFVDYGNYDDVSFRGLCQMVDKFVELPLVVVHCQIEGFTMEDVKAGGEALEERLQTLLPIYTTLTVNVVSHCKESLVYTVQIPSISVEEFRRK